MIILVATITIIMIILVATITTTIMIIKLNNIDDHPAHCSEGCIVKFEERVDRIDPEVATLVRWVGVIPGKAKMAGIGPQYLCKYHIGSTQYSDLHNMESIFAIFKYFSR